MEFSKEELRRYSRHLILPEVGKEGQEKLKQAKVLVVGAGGLGSPVLLYLAAAGIGKIGIVDFDKVDETNLQRQILYSERDVGKSKAETAKKHLEKLNSNIEIITYNEKLTSENALKIIKEYDIVVDGSDNFPTRYLVNDACFFLKKPNVYGAIFRFDGQASVFNYNHGPCYRCLSPKMPSSDEIPSCSEAGVLGVLPGTIGTIQATEAIKIILGKGNVLSEKVLVYNALEMEFTKLNLKKNEDCRLCGKSPEIREVGNYEKACDNKEPNLEITAKELKEMMDNTESLELLDVREQEEWEICKIESAKLVPLSKIQREPGLLDILPKNKKIVVYCHVGGRSAFVVNSLREKGYNARNLVGGIDAWSREVDENITTY
ncbi:molybdopterin-synthase adenylyltransferase MoeB [Candidatus Woesearchaeota archaeon]|nr:molybdopterin-synthase adenylyltransferase MoeB [Candidatus Woesearchaeota archaeon]